jgi:hypothetical protein
MRYVGLLLIIGAIAAGQRGYVTHSSENCRTRKSG